MKRLAVGFMLVVVVMCLACEDIVIGDSPIVVVGDTIYAFMQDGDQGHIQWSHSYGWVTIRRPYDEDTTITFQEEIIDGVDKIVMSTVKSGVLVFPIFECGHDPDCEYRLSVDIEDNW